MVAIQLFNDEKENPCRRVYGCVTSGSNWRFLQMKDKDLSIDRRGILPRDVAKILGILVGIARG